MKRCFVYLARIGAGLGCCALTQSSISGDMSVSGNMQFGESFLESYAVKGYPGSFSGERCGDVHFEVRGEFTVIAPVSEHLRPTLFCRLIDGSIELHWTRVAKNWLLERTESLVPADIDWEVIAPDLYNTSPTEVFIKLAVARTACFFRLRQAD